MLLRFLLLEQTDKEKLFDLCEQCFGALANEDDEHYDFQFSYKLNAIKFVNRILLELNLVSSLNEDFYDPNPNVEIIYYIVKVYKYQ